MTVRPVRSRTYRSKFVDAHGEPPYVCTGCNEVMHTLEVVHHADEDCENNALENLEPMHRACHVRYHAHSIETRAKMSDAQRGRTFSPETRAKISAAAQGRTVSPETRAKISAAIHEPVMCSACGKSYRGAWVTGHVTRGLCSA